jgi:hypothetical protein
MSKAVSALKDCISAMNEAVHHLESVQAAVPSVLRGTPDALKPGHIYDLKTAGGVSIGVDPRHTQGQIQPPPDAAQVMAFRDRIFVGGKPLDERDTIACPPPRDGLGLDAPPCTCSPSSILVEQLRTAIFRTEDSDLGTGGKRLQQLVLLALTHYEADVETF